MHIPDGFLDIKTAAAGGVLAAAAVAVSMRSVRSSPPRTIPLMGLTGAFIFAAQMVNFPVGPGTSGHLMGGALAAVLLGPAEAVITMTAVLIVQCFLFADGGFTALGANILNIAVAAPAVGSGVAAMFRRLLRSRGTVIAAGAFGGWCSTVAASMLCAGELAWSGTVPWSLAFPAMVNVHMVIGLGEAAITGVVLAAILRLRPELLDRTVSPGNLPAETFRLRARSAALGMVMLTATALFVVPFAFPLPDGLEQVARTLGFERFGSSASTGILAEYRFPGLPSATASTMAAGIVGAVAVFGLSLLLGRALTRDHGAS